MKSQCVNNVFVCVWVCMCVFVLQRSPSTHGCILVAETSREGPDSQSLFGTPYPYLWRGCFYIKTSGQFCFPPSYMEKHKTLRGVSALFTDHLLSVALALALAHSMATLKLSINLSLECRWKRGRGHRKEHRKAPPEIS